MDTDMLSPAACNANVKVNDPDATVDLRPPAPTPSNNKTSSSDKTLSAAAEACQDMSVTEDQQNNDDTRDMTTEGETSF